MWKTYITHRTAAHSFAATIQSPQKDGPGKAQAALRLATPASPFALEATFAVVKAEVPTGSTTAQACVLAEVVQGSNRRRGPISVEYYSTEPDEFDGRTVFARNGISEAGIPNGRFRLVEPGVLTNLDEHGQRVSMDKGTSLRDIYGGFTTRRPRASATPATSSSGVRKAAYSPETGGRAAKRMKLGATSTPGKGSSKGKGRGTQS